MHFTYQRSLRGNIGNAITRLSLQVKVLISLALFAASSASYAQTETRCASIIEDARENRSDIMALEAALDRANAACDAEKLGAISDLLAFALFNSARGMEGEARIQTLLRASSLTKDWRIHATLGGDYVKSGDHAKAAEALQLALVDLQERDGAGASEKAIQKIVTMTNNARALAGSYIANPKTRSGNPGGAAAETIGGVEIEAVPFPIEFEFAKAELTEDGYFGINDLVSILSGTDASALTLAGHTDPVGSEATNRILSEDRAIVVRNALVAALVPGAARIRVVGCGETSPPEIEAPDFYSEAEIHQIMRRVELVRRGEPCR